MIRNILIFGMVLLHFVSQAQSDESELIKKSDFYKANCMSFDRQRCDSIGGTSMELRICLNFEFLEVDSVLYELNEIYITELDESLKVDWRKIHNDWLALRKSQALFLSKDYKGHEGMILYLNSLIVSTKQRIELLNYIIQFK